MLYLLTALGFFIVGGCEALFMRIQLAVPNNHFLKPETYDELFTLHGTTMIFLVVVPTLLGLSMYLVPLMIGARDVAFPRLNALGYWLLLFGGIFLYSSILFGNAPDMGWFSYAPAERETILFAAGRRFLGAGPARRSAIGTVASGINLDRHHLHTARSGRHDEASSTLRLDDDGEFLPDRLRTPGVERLAGDAADRPRAACALLHSRCRRFADPVAAFLLVLRAPGGLYHGAPGLRHHLRGDSGLFTEADFRIWIRRGVDGGHRPA